MSEHDFPAAGVAQLKDHAAETVATIRVTTNPQSIGEELGVILPEVSAHVASVGLKMTGPPFARYHGFGDTVDMEAGFAVSGTGSPGNRVQFAELSAGRVATIWHAGDYASLGRSWEALRTWIAEQGLAPSEPCWEVYWTDPRQLDDPADWRTEILWTVE